MSNLKHTKFNKIKLKMKELVEKTLSDPALVNSIILKKGQTYIVYGLFQIAHNESGWIVTKLLSGDKINFNIGKAAIAWCTAYAANRFILANEIRNLDSKIALKQANIEVLAHHLKRNEGNETILQAKLTEDLNNKLVLKKQLEKSIDSTKYIKIKGSLNEFSRFVKTN